MIHHTITPAQAKAAARRLRSTTGRHGRVAELLQVVIAALENADIIVIDTESEESGNV